MDENKQNQAMRPHELAILGRLTFWTLTFHSPNVESWRRSSSEMMRECPTRAT